MRLSYKKTGWEQETDSELTHRFNYIPLTIDLIFSCESTLFTFSNQALPSQFKMVDDVPYAELELQSGQSFEVDFSEAIINENADICPTDKYLIERVTVDGDETDELDGIVVMFGYGMLRITT